MPTARSTCALVGAVWALAGGCRAEPSISPRGTQVGQANPPLPINPIQVDRVLQVERPAVDVLFVVDNSCSMEEEQQLLAENFPLFIQYFLLSGVDFHIGVVSMDMVGPLDAGKLRSAQGYRFIDEQTENPEAVFAQMVSLGSGGSGLERGFDTAYVALETLRESPTNQGFYRGGAGLEVVFVADEDDDSTIVSRPEFIDWFSNLKWSPDRANAHAIVAPEFPEFDDCLEATEPGSDFIEVAQSTGGQVHSLCDPWGPMLDSLGLAASSLKLEFFLSRLPVIDTIDVVVRTPDGVELVYVECLAGEEAVNPDCEVLYTPARNSIAFLGEEPEPFSEIEITYNVLENFGSAPDPGGTSPSPD